MCNLVLWTTARQIWPSMGLWLLIGVNTYPTPVALHSPGRTKLACVLLHLMGAGMMFMGYLVCEMKCVGMWPFVNDKRYHRNIKGKEWWVRMILCAIIGLFFILFVLTQGFMTVVKERDTWCCADTWAMKGDEIETKHGKTITVQGEPVVMNTASGDFLKLKIASFVFEDIAGLAVVFSHLAIWFFCEERQMPHILPKLKSVYYVDSDDEEHEDNKEHGLIVGVNPHNHEHLPKKAKSDLSEKQV
mmetsp:Transcript_76827/g.248838  ORF Transcript_76827/g.248838 Transcript_76827/m.248838 type:complete len:245 (+) Transcript_76827:584-1318(+)